MRDDPGKHLQWLQQQLLEDETDAHFTPEGEALLQRADALMENLTPEDTPVGNFSRKSKGFRAEQAHIRQQFDESAAVLTKTKRQLRKEAKQQKKLKKKESVNRDIRGLIFLAILECIGIVAILGWWLQ